MGYHYRGFFAAHPSRGGDILDAAWEEWPGCRGKIISSPFSGMGFSLPDCVMFRILETPEVVAEVVKWVERRLPPELADCGMDDDGKIYEFGAIVARELVEWSRNFPEANFVYLTADCFGGICDYEGYACRNGEVAYRHPDSSKLSPLIRFLDPDLQGEEYFEPLTRGYFDQTG